MGGQTDGRCLLACLRPRCVLGRTSAPAHLCLLRGAPHTPPLQEAQAAKVAQGLPRAKQAVEQARRADPLWVRAHVRGGVRGTCGTCPACRQVSLPLALVTPERRACLDLACS